MIKIFNANERDFSTAGNIIIEPIKCIEHKKKSLNGWYIEVEVPIKYKEYINKDKLCVVKTKSKLNPQAFRVGDNIQYTTKRIKFTADHVMFDSKDYVLLDVRPTNQNALNALNYINERTDNASPFSIYSNVENVDTAYFIRKNLLEAWSIIEERWGGVFDADNWNISFFVSLGNDNGETVAYGKNMQGFDIYEDWSSVCTKLCPVGYDGLLLPEEYIESDIQYEKPYTRVVDFQTNLEVEQQTEGNLLAELRENAEAYLEENKYPKVSYTIISNINQKLEIGDTVKVSHPFVELFTEVLEYEYDLILKRVKSLTFGNYSKDVKTKFNNIKNTINQINQVLSKQEVAINTQTNLINTLNKNGYVYIDDNEILILDALPKEAAKNVWRFGLGGIGFSSNGYEGPFEIAMTMDGQINANFITTGTLNVNRIEGLSGTLTSIEVEMDSITQTVGKQNQKIAIVEQTVNELNSKISDIADITTSKESTNARIDFDGINQSEPIYIHIRPIGENISYLYPHAKLFPSDTLFLKSRTLRFTNTTTNETWDYELPANLLIYDSENYDEFILDYDSQTVMVNKRCGYNADGTVKLLDAMTTYSYDFPKIELTDGDYTVELLGYNNAYMMVRLMAQNIYTTQFATKAEMNSEISQTAEEIDLSVDKKLTNYSTTTQMNSAINVKANEITSTVSETYETKSNANNKYATKTELTTTKSEIKQTTDSISLEVGKKVNNADFTSANITLKLNDGTSEAKIKADKININGTVSANGNFKVDTNGNMSCKNATIDGTLITNGNAKIYADGNIHIKDTANYDNAHFRAISADGLMHSRMTSNGFWAQDTSSGVMTQITPHGIQTPSLSATTIVADTVLQTSVKNKKKNFEKLDNETALSIVLNTDIYKYHLKSQEDTEKKHIGFVIGDTYNYSKDITSNKNDGVDNYSMTSASYGAIQKLYEIIQEQQKKIEELERITKGE